MTATKCLHIFRQPVPKAPEKLNNPFHYEPHPLTLAAASQLQDYLQRQTQWHEELEKGKMFGVLVVRKGRKIGFLAAFSGLLGERSLWPYFVPPIYDSQQPEGYFKQEERNISSLFQQVKRLKASDDYIQLKQDVAVARQEAERLIASYKQEMAQAKKRRDLLRETADDASKQALIRESQFMKAELGRKKKQAAQEIALIEEQLNEKELHIRCLQEEHRKRSDDLQKWLFSQFVVLNAQGEHNHLTAIFEAFHHRLPPSGAGDCCAPKLLQYAYQHQLTPVCMGEFWWGQSPKGEVRHHLHFYPACRGKCMPILQFMLQGLDVEPYSLNQDDEEELTVAYEDDWLCVVRKPAGMLSVPGRSARRSVVSILQQRWKGKSRQEPLTVHRLDMDTSGLLIVAKTPEVHQALQEQFAKRSVRKKYVAVLEGIWKGKDKGNIQLPLRPEPTDRPRQVVDTERGKTAITSFQILDRKKGRTLIALYPHTGRTHQLRVHCAHQDGLALPIVGDALYGKTKGQTRLLLHAEQLSFVHPVSGKKMNLKWTHPFNI